MQELAAPNNNPSQITHIGDTPRFLRGLDRSVFDRRWKGDPLPRRSRPPAFAVDEVVDVWEHTPRQARAPDHPARQTMGPLFSSAFFSFGRLRMSTGNAKAIFARHTARDLQKSPTHRPD